MRSVSIRVSKLHPGPRFRNSNCHLLSSRNLPGYTEKKKIIEYMHVHVLDLHLKMCQSLCEMVSADNICVPNFMSVGATVSENSVCGRQIGGKTDWVVTVECSESANKERMGSEVETKVFASVDFKEYKNNSKDRKICGRKRFS